ncbi:MAG: hypothetical protein K6G33_13045 [Ruminococcus sp.]|uniref:dockerin type I domain-containing protein n=1 Tax=Ruminococcus sp. TaxID=41978 RepID=UPI0025CE1784|nr:dockerin type I domain-containing protein [Ruminococcus sp.]MCR5601657.1 hypothetical protein [Ruminococcus sp.]
MKNLFAKIISFTTAVSLLFVSTTTQVFAAGKALGDEYDLSELDLSKAQTTPVITISQEEIPYEEAISNPVRTVSVSISGAQKAYANAGFTIRFDDRLTLIKDEDDELAVPGKALRSCHSMFCHDTDHGFRAIVASPDNVGRDGEMFSFTVKLPDNISDKGGTFPIELYYNKENDLFTNIDVDDNSKLMEASLFSQGIEQGFIKVQPKTSQPIGDTNNDGKIDSLDATRILLLVAHISAGGQVSDMMIAIFDVNGDKIVDSLDASAIIAYTLFSSLNNYATPFLDFLKATGIRK